MSQAYKLFTLKNIPSPKFVMTPLELSDYLDFEVKRVYFITSPTGDSGQHAHRRDEDELFVMIQGSCTIVVDDGSGLKDVQLVGPKNAIYVPHMVWHGFKNLSSDAIILALTSTNYDATRSDYVENYDDFRRLVEESSSTGDMANGQVGTPKVGGDSSQDLV